MDKTHTWITVICLSIVAVMAMVARRVYELLTVNDEYEMRKP